MESEERMKDTLVAVRFLGGGGMQFEDLSSF